MLRWTWCSPGEEEKSGGLLGQAGPPDPRVNTSQGGRAEEAWGVNPQFLSIAQGPE